MRKNKKIRVALVFGGKSAEHEVSLQSAKNVYEAMDKEKYEIILAGIDKSGRWRLISPEQFLVYVGSPKTAKPEPIKSGLALVPGDVGRTWIDISGKTVPGIVDVVFPVLHGPYGEDGTVQGMLKLADVPFVGAGVLGSAIGMDKDAQKRLLREAGIPHARFVSFTKGDPQSHYAVLAQQLGTPFFIKPANLGSSVGVHKIRNEDQFKESAHDAFLYDTKLIAEEYIEGRELECAVLGNENPAASLAGEVIPQGHEFYNYEAKYLDEHGAVLKIPAELPPETMARVRSLAVKTFQTLCCEGMARVDFFLKNTGELLVNELNTIPGFTKISMYPKLWEASGVSYKKLIDKLITLAIQRFNREKKMRTIYEA